MTDINDELNYNDDYEYSIELPKAKFYNEDQAREILAFLDQVLNNDE